MSTHSIKTVDSCLQSFLITENTSVKEAMKQMSEAGKKILFVIDQQNKLCGSLTDGDIRRWVLKEGSILARVAGVYQESPICFNEDYDIGDIKKIMLAKRINGVPVINRQREIVRILLWEDIFGNGNVASKETIDIPVVIMAGGKGDRLDPFTRILPKPLIPIGEKAIIELIMEKFLAYGVKEFFVTVNHKSRMIKAYFDEIKTPYRINYIKEDNPMGTAGSLRLLEQEIKKSVLVSNCDIIIESDYSEIVDFHEEKNNDITIVGSFRHFTIPYGICTIEAGGQLMSLEEKPERDFLVNTGMYLLKKDVLSLIPENQRFDMTDLVRSVKKQGGKVGVFPIDAKSWIDVGQWEEYHKSIKDLGYER